MLGGRLAATAALLRARGAGAPPVLHYVAAGGAGDGDGDGGSGAGANADAPDPALVTTVVVPVAPDDADEPGRDGPTMAAGGGGSRCRRRRLHLPAVLADLAARGVRSVMVEGGGAVLGSFLAPPAADAAGSGRRPPLVDAVVVTVAPLLVGAPDAVRVGGWPHPPAPTLTSTARLAARGGRVPRRRRGDGGRGVAAGGHLAGGRAAALAPRCRWLSPQRRVAVTTAAAAAAAAVAATTAAAAAGQAAAEEAVPRSPSALPLYPFPPFPAPSLSRLHPLSALNT